MAAKLDQIVNKLLKALTVIHKLFSNRNSNERFIGFGDDSENIFRYVSNAIGDKFFAYFLALCFGIDSIIRITSTSSN